MKISAVIPVIDEAEGLPELVSALRKRLEDMGNELELIVVDGGSTDDTVQTARSLGAVVLTETGSGFGAAIRRGITESTGDYVLTMDADGSHDPEYVPAMVEAAKHCDMVIASRYVKGGGMLGTPIRRYLSRILNWWLRHLLSLPVRDISGGFKLYRRDMFEEFTTKSRNFDIQAETLIHVVAKGFRTDEVPYEYRPRSHGLSKARLWAYGWAFLRTGLSLRRLRNTVYFADYDHRARHSRIPLQRWWHWKRNRLINGFLEGRDPAVDVGCGSGQFALSGRPAALDRDTAKARYVKNNGGKSVCGDAAALPFREEVFEEAVCSEVVEHVQGDDVFIELARVLKPGGNLVLTTPDYSSKVWRVIEWLYERILPGAYAEQHITRYNEENLREKLSNSGFSVIETKKMAMSITALKARKE